VERAISVLDIGHKFENRVVLEHINLEIAKGEIFGLLGPSGAGKTTLIKLLTGQLKPVTGRAVILGRDASKLSGQDYSQIGIMMDHFGLYDRLSCYDNLKLFAKIYNIPKEKIGEALERVGLADAGKTTVMNLSKGMRSRLLFARALMRSPSILFLDEPTSGLDPLTAQELHKLILQQRKDGVAVFLTTHNMAEAEKLCDNIALLHQGRIVEQGSPVEICRRYNHQKKIRIHLQDGTDMELPHDKSITSVLENYLKKGVLETIHSTEPNLETVFMELTGRRLE